MYLKDRIAPGTVVSGCEIYLRLKYKPEITNFTMTNNWPTIGALIKEPVHTVVSKDDYQIIRPYCRHYGRLVEPDGIEPTTSCLQSRRSTS